MRPKVSDKPFAQLNRLDQLLRMHFPVGNIEDGVKVTIELIHGFELFNTRPYHNYESWSDGYRIKDTKTGVQHEAEDLDDAIRGFISKVNDYRSKNGMRVTEERKVTVIEDVSL